MANIADVLEALATRISTGMTGTRIGGRTYPFAPDDINPPCAICLPSPGNFLTFDTSPGTDDMQLVVKVLMGTQHDRAGQTELLGYLARDGSTSLRTVIYADATLGGVVDDLKVAGAINYGDVEWAGVVYYGADLVVDVYA